MSASASGSRRGSVRWAHSSPDQGASLSGMATPTRLRNGEPAAGCRSTVLWRAAMLYFFCAPLDIIPTPVGTPSSWTAMVFLGVWVCEVVVGTTRLPKPSSMLLVLFGIPLWSFTTVFWSFAPEVSLLQSVTTTLLVVSAVAISTTAVGERALLAAASAMAGGSAVAAAAAIVSDPDAVSGRATFLDIDQNVLAFHLALGLACSLYLVLRGEATRTRWSGGAFSLLILVALVLVGSRTGIGAALVLIASYALLVTRNRKRAVGAILVLLAIVAVGWYVVGVGLVPPRISEWLASPVATDERQLIIDAYRLTEERWLLAGVGAGADAEYLWLTQAMYFNAHSAFWKILIELGVVGLILWALLLTGLARRASVSASRAFFVLVTIPIALFFYTLGPISSNMLWAVFGLALGAARRRVSTSARAPAVYSRRHAAGERRSSSHSTMHPYTEG